MYRISETAAEPDASRARIEVRRLTSLYRLAGALLAESSLDRVIDEVLLCARDTTGASCAGLSLLDERGAPALRFGAGLTRSARAVLQDLFPWQRGEEPAPVLVPDTSAGGALVAPLAKDGDERIGALALLPLVVGGRSQGMLAVGYGEARAFEAEDVVLLEAVARHLAAHLARRPPDLRGGTTGSSPFADLARRFAERSGARFRVLAEASRLFAQVGLSLDEVLRSIVKTVAEVLGDSCTLFLMSDDGECLEPVALDHRSPQARPVFERALWQDRLPMAASIVGGSASSRQTAFLPVISEDFALSVAGPYREYVTRFGVTSSITVPLVVQRRVLGALVVTRMRGSAAYSSEDRILLENLADHAALAIANARSFAAEQDAKLEATRATRWLERLQVATEGLTAAIEPDDVVEAVLQAAADALRPDSAAVCLVEEGSVRISGSFVRREGVLQRERLPLSDGVVYASAAQDDSPRFLESPEALHACWPDVAPLVPTVQAMAAIPLVSREQPLGVLALGFSSPRSFSSDERDFLCALGQQASVSLERALLFEAVKAREEEALRVAEFQNQLLGIVGHDLRNPLAAIRMGAAVLARMVAGDERQSKLLSRIISSTERGDRLIRELLDFTRARIGGGIPIERCRVDLAPLARGLVEELEAANPGRVVRVRVEGDARGEWDGDRMAQVISNLLTNALHYSPPESEVSLTVDASEDTVRISTHNVGEPIPPERLGALFEPFCRLEDRPDGSKSLGLGLYIVREIVRAHDGTVSAVSTTEAGTEFRVEIPRRPATRGLEQVGEAEVVVLHARG